MHVLISRNWKKWVKININETLKRNWLTQAKAKINGIVKNKMSRKNKYVQKIASSNEWNRIASCSLSEHWKWIQEEMKTWVGPFPQRKVDSRSATESWYSQNK